MKEYFVYKKNYIGALSSALLAKCLHQKVWDDSPYLLKQLPGIGMVTAKVCSLTHYLKYLFSLRVLGSYAHLCCALMKFLRH